MVKITTIKLFLLLVNGKYTNENYQFMAYFWRPYPLVVLDTL